MDNFIINANDVVSVVIPEPVATTIVMIEGPQGLPGTTGPAGVAGVAGSAGNPGAAATVVVGTVTTGSVGSQAYVTNVGTSSAAILNFTLPGGVAGATGAQGVAGSPGAQGIQGEQGLQGIPGAVGPAGPIGLTGAGVQGIQGIQGVQGAAGATGPAGPAGAQGSAGISLDIQGSVSTYANLPANAQQGDAWIVLADGRLYFRDANGFPADGQGVPFQGPQGIQGPVGATGAVGPTGAQGIQGVAGPAGSVGASGSAGAQGIQGIQGQKGDTGRGFTWRGEFSGSNTYAVDDVVSLSGSSYVCLTAATTQSPTASPSSWSLLASKGDTGSAGAAGAQGVQGIQGVPGADSVVPGPTGATGATGPAGTTTWSGLTGVPSDIVYESTAQTLASKRITQRVNTVASSATPAINTDTTDLFTITALAANITSMTSGLTGTPTEGQKLLVRIKGVAAQTISWGASFSSSGVATLLATTVAGKTHMVGLIYDSAAAKWVCAAVDATGY